LKNSTKEIILIKSHAYLWDGTKQLSGTLELWPSQLVFHFDDFQMTHLNLNIPLEKIEYAKVFMIFNIAKNGLKVKTREGKIDLFVLKDCREFYRVLTANI